MKHIALALVLAATACTTATLKKDATAVEAAAVKVIDCVTGQTKSTACQIADIFASWIQAKLNAPVAREESAPQGPTVEQAIAAWRAEHPGVMYRTPHGLI